MRDGFHAAVINALALTGRRRSRFREGTAQYVRSPAGLWFCALPRPASALSVAAQR